MNNTVKFLSSMNTLFSLQLMVRGVFLVDTKTCLRNQPFSTVMSFILLLFPTVIQVKTGTNLYYPFNISLLILMPTIVIIVLLFLRYNTHVKVQREKKTRKLQISLSLSLSLACYFSSVCFLV